MCVIMCVCVFYHALYENVDYFFQFFHVCLLCTIDLYMGCIVALHSACCSWSFKALWVSKGSLNSLLLLFDLDSARGFSVTTPVTEKMYFWSPVLCVGGLVFGGCDCVVAHIWLNITGVSNGRQPTHFLAALSFEHWFPPFDWGRFQTDAESPKYCCTPHSQSSTPSQLHTSPIATPLAPNFWTNKIQLCLHVLQRNHRLRSLLSFWAALLHSDLRQTRACSKSNASTAKPMDFALSHTLAPWNNLPQHIRHSATVSSFKSKLKTFLLSEYFS